MPVITIPAPLARLTPWIVPVAIIAGWQAAASLGLVSTRFMPCA